MENCQNGSFYTMCWLKRQTKCNAQFTVQVCCMYTAKHASIIRDRIKDIQIYVSYIDVNSKRGYKEEFYKTTGKRYILYKGHSGEITG